MGRIFPWNLIAFLHYPQYQLVFVQKMLPRFSVFSLYFFFVSKRHLSCKSHLDSVKRV